MCTYKFIDVKSISCRGVKVAAVPCGVCPTCRKREQLEWSFRLKTELLSLDQNEWYCVFFTQTYNDWSLPHFPRFLLNSNGEKKFPNVTPMCFSKDDIREFHTNLRYWLERECGAKGEKRYKWMTCAEYGENTHRCHYHSLLCVPKCVDAHALFDKVNELWRKKGFIFPKKFDGGIDKYNYVHKPFVVDSIEKAAGYCSKYISKDIAFEESIDRNDFCKCKVIKETYIDKRSNQKKEREKKIRLSDYTCFHLQSRSLGKSFVDSLDDDQKLDFIENGYHFVGDEFCHHVPKYMLNKFLFENYYVKIGKVEPKRYVLTRPTHFFYKNHIAIFRQKVYNMSKKIKEFWFNYYPHIGKFTNEVERINFDRVVDRFKQLSTEEIAEKVVAYCGLNPNYVGEFLTPAEMWFRRYDHYCYESKGKRVVVDNTDDLEGVYEEGEFCECCIPRDEIDYINKFYFWMMILKSRIDLEPDKLKMIDERNIAWVRDSFSSCEDY